MSTALAAAASPLLPKLAHAEAAAPTKLKGNINHSACRWCYKGVKLEDLCAAGKEMGLVALDLLGPYYRWRTSAFALGTLANGRLEIVPGAGHAAPITHARQINQLIASFLGIGLPK